MKIEQLKNKKIAILGYGVEGRALLKYLNFHGIHEITIFDEKEVDSGAGGFREKLGNDLVVCKFESIDFDSYDYIFRSPGVRLGRISKFIPRGVTKITSATNLFFGECGARIIGITGTKGKSTTAKIIEKILVLNNKAVFLGGNIGVVPLDYLDQLDKESIVVLELSSFQLEDLEFSPHISVILPISSDHLNYHENVDEYAAAKSSICRFQNESDTVVFYNDGKSKELANLSKGERVPYHETSAEGGCFLNDEDAVCEINGDLITYKRALNFSIVHKIPVVDVIAALSFAASQKLYVDLEEVFVGFRKMPYRIELVGEVGGVKFYNDSASTNPVSTVAAAKIFTEPYFLIAGGSSKNLDYGEMAEYLAKDQSLKGIFLTGNTAQEIKNSLIESGYAGKIVVGEVLDEIVHSLTRSELATVKSVLFSPASASFDQYQNHVKRGEHFTNLISKL